ncbi:magnesium-translocating P-type ATPase [Bosea sp. TND4EK4]|uniref:magnesium-translocating P-type ATPase n=1 Tax=Bosea sp. TND4EK4 TaxID=1907408 RepID=UPI000954D95A|nr:magnesium-translocating P-type ATPase [Bosea sp. TND4EK4]SIP88499.1 Mg2+-importing ATPase [Bosea sp. TND4EK4]
MNASLQSPGDAASLQEAPAALMARLRTQPEGLSEREAIARLKSHGPNVSVPRLRRQALAKVVRRLLDPLIAILLIAAAIAGVTGDWQSLLIIATIIFASVLLDVVQETQAEHAVDALRRKIAVRVDVLRSGAVREIPLRDVVPGDVVLLRAGDLVPADGVILESTDAMADEAALTGEAFPVEKRAAMQSVPGPGAALFGGTSLVAGEAKLLVVATGPDTKLGAVARSMQQSEPPTAFERGVHRLGLLILRLTGFLVLFVLLTQLVRQGLSMESFLFAVALAVGLTPELLPVVMTVTLARGAMRMAKRDVVVKRLSAIYDLGAMDVLCTDKTGTLTQARIAHVGSFDAAGSSSERVTGLARLNSLHCGSPRNNLDDALLASAEAVDRSWDPVARLPFDFTRRRSSVLLARGAEQELVVKGAPEGLLRLCDRAEDDQGGIQRLDNAARERILRFIDGRGAEGLRLLGVARKPMADQQVLSPEDENALIFVGCAAFLDPPKPSAGQAAAELARMGVRIKVISGDAAPVVQHLAATLDLPVRRLMTGEQVAALGDAALARQVAGTDLFARVEPEQKARIVLALRRGGHTVGFIGDGINDAPAIHSADVGLSVDTGTEVAREAAAIVLLAADLSVVARGIAEGRRTYANIMKYLRMGTSSNFGNMLSMALASVFLPFLPLNPLQILVNNMLYDLSEIGIPFDEADPDDVASPRQWQMGSVLRFTLIMGPLSSIFDLAMFALLLLVFQADVASFRTAWFVQSVLTQILVIFVIRTTLRCWRSRPHPALVFTSLGALVLALVLALTPVGSALGFVAIPSSWLFSIGVIAIAYLSLAEALKRTAMSGISRRRHAPGGRRPGLVRRFRAF